MSVSEIVGLVGPGHRIQSEQQQVVVARRVAGPPHGLPTADERAEIFAVHLVKRQRLKQDYDLAALTQASEGYVGAEIEQAIIDAMSRRSTFSFMIRPL